MSYNPPPSAGRRIFLELCVRDDDHGQSRLVKVPLDVPVPPGGSIHSVPAAQLLAIVRSALGLTSSG